MLWNVELMEEAASTSDAVGGPGRRVDDLTGRSIVQMHFQSLQADVKFRFSLDFGQERIVFPIK